MSVKRTLTTVPLELSVVTGIMDMTALAQTDTSLITMFAYVSWGEGSKRVRFIRFN